MNYIRQIKQRCEQARRQKAIFAIRCYYRELGYPEHRMTDEEVEASVRRFGEAAHLEGLSFPALADACLRLTIYYPVLAYYSPSRSAMTGASGRFEF